VTAGDSATSSGRGEETAIASKRY